ncbi:dihydropteroate synthase [Brucella pseudogrignonensis]|jgi:dihydropteroate synthase|uniref:Dihydropteroate synthase n=1 Tax=Brucella pseudogrignonensis TaxID=419475 RepID=A0A256GE23_9HYPH|nr:dihydropteroate synthase [Brucella pseudogrignonensis]EMG54545.1 dihydropteroate synthase [Ochrobactrum sp. CDB2]KAB2691569.1 dihydropteroate synthase [Brucella pseudogrignonensis]MCD4511481.1 dihydropteroate synthase [Brucella pseudogrignonensis]OYR25359.1 dihydropteroate synthase [Brucella pseudogrignonensis]
MIKQWQLAHGRNLQLGAKSVIMGILNVTPDSFSDGGHHNDLDKALIVAKTMLDDGATIIDVGGESTRPGAALVDAETESARVVPVIRALAKEFGCTISIDTYRASTARLAVEAGAHIVNDVWGLQREPEIAQVAKDTGAGLVIMHTSRDRNTDPDVIADQFAFLDVSLEIASRAGIDAGSIVLDPGFGFGKNKDEDIALMARMEELQRFSYPLLVGTSRKRFIGAITEQADPLMRDIGTAATSVAMRLAGADIFRVHNVAFNRDALAVADAILQSRLKN